MALRLHGEYKVTPPVKRKINEFDGETFSLKAYSYKADHEIRCLIDPCGSLPYSEEPSTELYHEQVS
jgi:hypothetical protein